MNNKIDTLVFLGPWILCLLISPHHAVTTVLVFGLSILVSVIAVALFFGLVSILEG